jgi:hypothetical protein
MNSFVAITESSSASKIVDNSDEETHAVILIITKIAEISVFPAQEHRKFSDLASLHDIYSEKTIFVYL